jgi:hypothetical protein
MTAACLLGFALVVPFAALAATGTSSVYKCSLPEGGVVYQDAPCPAGRELRDFDRDPAEVSVVPAPSTARPPASGKGAATTRGKDEAARPPRAERSSKGSGDAAQRKFLAPGVGAGEVLARIGNPDMKTPGKGRRGERWIYLPAPADANTVTTLTFDGGRLIEVERKIVR